MTAAACVKAALVAGGKGTRIRPVAGEQVPKALVPVAGVPVAARLLRLLAAHGVKDVAICAGHLAESLRDGLAPYGAESGVRLEYFVEASPLGTAGCLRPARAFLGDGPFFVVYADVAVDMDLSRLLRAHEKNGAVATVVVHPNDHPHESDLMEVAADGRITSVLTRDRGPDGDYRNLVPAAIYCASPAVFDYIDPASPQDFVRDVFPRMAREGAPLFAYNTPEYLHDMGTPARFAAVERDLRSGLVERMHWSRARPAVFLDRDGVLNEDVGTRGVLRAGDLRLLPGAAEAVRAVNERGALAVVVTNQPQIAKGFITRAELEQVHGRLDTLLGREAARVDRIFYCPHHPESGFDGEVVELKTVCGCRKPAPGLLLQAAAELPIRMEESCLIGDTWRDVGAARAAGIRAYGVRTGNGCKGCSGDLRPDLMFSDVLQAVRFALAR